MSKKDKNDNKPNSFDALRQSAIEAAENPALRAAQKLAESPAYKAARDVLESPAYKAVHDVLKSPAYKAVRDVLENPAYKVAASFLENPALKAVMEMSQTPALSAALEVAANPALISFAETMGKTNINFAKVFPNINEVIGSSAALSLANLSHTVPDYKLAESHTFEPPSVQSQQISLPAEDSFEDNVMFEQNNVMFEQLVILEKQLEVQKEHKKTTDKIKTATGRMEEHARVTGTLTWMIFIIALFSAASGLVMCSRVVG